MSLTDPTPSGNADQIVELEKAQGRRIAQAFKFAQAAHMTAILKASVEFLIKKQRPKE